jgi:hypothetical protein
MPKNPDSGSTFFSMTFTNTSPDPNDRYRLISDVPEAVPVTLFE